jgi:hypothetical protein
MMKPGVATSAVPLRVVSGSSSSTTTKYSNGVHETLGRRPSRKNTGSVPAALSK